MRARLNPQGDLTTIGTPPAPLDKTKPHPPMRIKLVKQLGPAPKEIKPPDAAGKDEKDKELSRDDLKGILERTLELTKLLQSRHHLKYEVIEEADLVQVQVIDSDDGSVIRKIPADKVVELVKKIHEMLSDRLDVKV